MRHRLRHAKEHQPNAHTGGKKHGEPSHISIIRLCIRTPQSNFAKWRDHQKQTKQHENICRTNKEPIKCGCYRVPQRTKKFSCLSLKHQGNEYEDDDRKSGYQKNRIVDIEPKGRDVLLTNFIVCINGVRN